MTAVIIPYNPRHEVFCPKCNSLHTIYWPSRREGHCEDCGFDWRFPPYRKPFNPIRNGGPIT